MSEFAWQRGKEYQEIIYETLDASRRSRSTVPSVAMRSRH